MSDEIVDVAMEGVFHGFTSLWEPLEGRRQRILKHLMATLISATRLLARKVVRLLTPPRAFFGRWDRAL